MRSDNALVPGCAHLNERPGFATPTYSGISAPPAGIILWAESGGKFSVSDARPVLLYVTRRPPFPLTNGGRIRAHRLLVGLSTVFDTTLLTFEHHARSPDGNLPAGDLRDLLPGIRVETVPGSGPGKRGRQLRSLLGRRSWEFGRYRLPAMGRALTRVRGEVQDGRGVVAHFDDLAVAQFAPVRDALNVYSAHNVEYRIIEGATRTSTGLRRAFASVERAKVKHEEIDVWQGVDLCLAVSDPDADQIRAGGGRVIVCPNGADPVRQLPYPARAADEPLRILFVGSVAYRPNHQGLEWFVAEVLPLLRREVPAVVDVVGSPPRRFAGDTGVVLHGSVDSLLPFYERSHAAIVPVLYGSGTRLKVLEAMAYGRPVVATAVGAEGLPVSAGDHYLQADDAFAFAAALAWIGKASANGDAGLPRMISRARNAVEPLFWPSITSRLARVYLDEIGVLEQRGAA
jgi:polysaccharide biosynthesis protein PslH